MRRCDSHGVNFTRVYVIFAITCVACPSPMRRNATQRFLRKNARCSSSTDPFTVVEITPSWFLADSRRYGRAPAISSSQVSFSYVLFPETADSRKLTAEWDITLSRYATRTATINGRPDFTQVIGRGMTFLLLKLTDWKYMILYTSLNI